MTTFFAFADLTWPEVAALPRDLPLVLPLGEGYDRVELAQALGSPPRVGLLPAIPFGWPGSRLEVAPELLDALIANLIANLAEDGFSNVHVLTPPHASRFTFHASRITLTASPSPVLALDPTLTILLPIGHTEQHGYHLPLSTDTDIIAALSQGVAAAVPDLAATLPAFPYGVSTHRRSFAGTFNVGGRAFEDFWLGVLDALVGRGFRRFYFLSGHGGNCSFLNTVVKYAGERYPRIFAVTAWLYLSGPEGVAALTAHRRSAIGGMGHAGELETALMLHLRPVSVFMDRVVDETDFISTPSYYMDWVEGGALVANPPWEDDTATGAYGAGSLATAEHGRIWLDAAIAEKVGHVREIIEQHRRRGG